MLKALLFATAVAGAATDVGPKQYQNPEYGFSVRVPSGVKVMKSEPPAPDHGIQMRVKGRDGAVTVDATYNSTLLSGLDAIVEDDLERMRSERAEIRSTSRTKVKLGCLPATRLRVAFRKAGESKDRIRDVVLALRPGKADDVGVIYSVELSCALEDSERLGRVLEATLREWRCAPLP